VEQQDNRRDSATLRTTLMPPVPKLLGPNRTYERWRWQIFGITWLAYAGYYLTRKSFWVAKIDLEKPQVMGLTNSDMGWIDVGNQLAYAIGQFAWGMCGDRFGTRNVVLTGMLGSVVVAGAMGMSPSVLLLGLFFGLQGFFQSSGWAPLTKNVSCFFSQRERGTVMGVWFTNYAIGGLIASPFAGYFGQVYGWRYAFFAPAAALLIVWVLFYLFQRNRPEDVGLPSIEQYHGEPEAKLEGPSMTSEERDGTWKTIGEVVRSPMVLLLSAVYFFFKPTRYAILAWGPKYLNERLGTDMTASGALSSLFELAGPISILLGGVISDRIFKSKRMPLSIVCLVLLAIMLFTMDKLPHSKVVLGGCLFLIGLFLFAPDSLVSGTAAVDFGTKKGAATAAGIINGCGSLGAVVGVGVPGFFHDQWGWDGVFTFLGVSVLLAALLLLPKWNALPKGSNGG
jgi:OPA family sugar phosphate sensor protein UhpC-like MFS transporter